MDDFTLKEHLVELKGRLLRVVLIYFCFFVVSYIASEQLLRIVFEPVLKASDANQRIIFTDLSEAFWGHLRVASFFALLMSYPCVCYQLYRFIAPGLYVEELYLARFILFLSPVFLILGCLFLYYIIIPNAWAFFIGYEQKFAALPVSFEAKISEYLDFFIGLMFVFGGAFQLPIIISIMCIMGFVTSSSLRNRRRAVIVLLFVVGAVFTPPDVFSQIALAIPLVLLYEFSILICSAIEKRLKNRC